MLAYILRRTLFAIFTIWAISIISFFIIQLPPGDYVTAYISELQASGTQVTQDTIAALREQYGLDQPFLVQYGKWMGRIVRGDLGVFHVADPVEKFVQIVLGGVEAEVADVEFRRGDLDGFGLARRARFGAAAAAVVGRICGACSGAGGFGVKLEKADEFLPEGFFGGRTLRLLLAGFVAVAVAAGRGGAARAAARAAAGAAAGVLGSHVWDFYCEALWCPESARVMHTPSRLAGWRATENFAGGCRGEPLGEACVHAARWVTNGAVAKPGAGH